jgi:hypothetical protein
MPSDAGDPAQPSPNGRPSAQAILAAAQEGRFVIEEFTSLTDSLDFDLGQQYWRQAGSKAFTIAVPCASTRRMCAWFSGKSCKSGKSCRSWHHWHIVQEMGCPLTDLPDMCRNQFGARGATAGMRAIAAQLVAATEIHWSCPCGKPLSKKG